MFSIGNKKHQQVSKAADLEELTILKRELNAIRSHTAFIRFDPTGNILNANGIFLAAVGYTLEEIVGKHHRMFCKLRQDRSGRMNKGDAPHQTYFCKSNCS